MFLILGGLIVGLVYYYFFYGKPVRLSTKKIDWKPPVGSDS